MKKLSKNPNAYIHTIEAYEADTVCDASCELSCHDGCKDRCVSYCGSPTVTGNGPATENGHWDTYYTGWAKSHSGNFYALSSS